MLVVNADSTFQTLKDLVDAMQAKRRTTISTGLEAGWPSSTVAEAVFLATAG